MVDILAPVDSRVAPTSSRLLVARGAAVVSVSTAVIHFAVAGQHFQEYWVFGVFMLVVAWLQLAWAAAVVIRPSRTALGLGAALNLGVVAVYVITRTVGDVIGPTPHEAEPIGFGDAFCTVGEALVAVAAVLLLLRPLGRAVSRGWAARALVSTGTLAAVLLSVSLVAGGPDMVMSMAGNTAAGPVAPISLPTQSPAGPVTMPDPGMQMASGMKMAGGSCTQTPTVAQQSATTDLVNTTWTDARKYQSLAQARAAGYRPVTPTGQAVVHYINPADYRATVQGGPVLDPSAPQSLVYANTPHGAVLAAAMYIQPPTAEASPDPGGCLTQWHVHTNLCFARGAGIVGEADPICSAGSTNRTTPPMLHIWFVPIPGGPTAVDATDPQVVHAAEQVTTPHNPQA